MKRRDFARNSSIVLSGMFLLPPLPTSSRLELISSKVHRVEDPEWLLGALGTFARYAAIDVLAGHVWDWLFEDDGTEKAPQDPVRNEVRGSVGMMQNGGFNDFSTSSVYNTNNTYNIYLYQGTKPASMMNNGRRLQQDICVGVTRKAPNGSPSTPIMLDGPAMGMMANVAKDIREKTDYGPRGVRGLLLPSGNIYRGSTGNLHTGYSDPIVYDTDANKQVTMSYGINRGVGSANIHVRDKSDWATLINRDFEFRV